MKNIFAMDISTEENGNSYGEADRFILRRVKEELAEQQDEMNEGIEEHKKNSELPVWLTIVRYICLFLFLVVVSATIKAGFDTAMRNAPGLVIAGAFGGIVALVLWLIGKKKMKNVVESDDFNDDIA